LPLEIWLNFSHFQTPGYIEMNRLRQYLNVTSLMVLLLPPAIALAVDPYPSKPIRLVVGYAAGGSADTTARHLADWVSKRIGQPVLIDNKGGAAGSIAAASVAAATADGYTLLYSTSDLVMYPTLHRNVSYSPLKDFAPITGLQTRALVLVTHPSLGVKTVQELIALAKAKPGQLNFESSGLGSVEHLAGEVFQSQAGISMVHVPYKGSAPAVVDLVAGRIQVGFEVPLNVEGHIKSGKLVPLMSTGRQRLGSFPKVPSAPESGLPAMVLNVPWAGILAPAGTPADRIALLNSVFTQARNAKETVAHPVFADAIPMTGTPQAFGTFIAAELARWAKIVAASGIQPE
jgi:tripartite-type tricarboxylate transporter receptor subunit TctC